MYSQLKIFLSTTEMPDGASLGRHTFDTLAREKAFKTPSTTASTVPILNEFVAPHIESFNTLFDDSGLAPGDGDGRGLLSLAIRDIGERVVFDGAGPGKGGQTEWGNRLSSKNLDFFDTISSSLRVLKFGLTMSPLRDLWFPTKTNGQ